MPTDDARQIHDATCTACGCLCDDIALRIEGNRVAAADRACPIGASWFLADHSGDDSPAAIVDGMPATVSDAIDRAAEILHLAKSPVICGLTRTTIEAQSLAVALADGIGATIDPAHSREAMPRLRAVQDVGFVSATLGEVKNRGDVIVFWGVDPVATHPRHFERYSVEPRGRFVADGRAVIVVDDAPTMTSARSDQFVQIAAERWGEALVSLRAIVRGIDLPDADPRLISLASTMRRARYGVLFFGTSLGQAPGGPAVVESALKLVRDLNASTRFVALTLAGPGNPGGIEAVLTSQAGSPLAVDFQAGFPRYLPDEATSESRLARGEADAALIVADDPREFLSKDAMAHLSRIPTIRIAPDATSGAWPATVAIASATYGIHAGGTVMRSDGVTLPLRPALTTSRPSDRDLLAAILRKLDAPTGLEVQAP